jgi:hypothetical protein
MRCGCCIEEKRHGTRGRFIARCPGGPPRLRWPVRKELDDRETSRFTGATYPRTRRSFLEVLEDLVDDDESDDDDDDVEKQADHHASTVADLLVESGRFPDRPAALHHLLNKPSGQAFLARLHKAAETEKESNMDSFEKMVKDRGIVAVAKAMVDEDRSYGLTETEFVTLATEDAVRKFPGEKTADRAFTRMFTDNGADGLAIRRAHRVVRAEQLGTAHAKAADRGSNSAYGELMHKAEAYREAHPELSISQAFEKIYTARDNVELAKRERRESAAAR